MAASVGSVTISSVPLSFYIFNEDCEALYEFKPDIYGIILRKIQFQKRN